jgi:GTPase SAR1 family protein
MLPQDVLDIISVFSGMYHVIQTLSPHIFHKFYTKHISLVYGQVQSGKTSMIIKLIQQSQLQCVLVIQNSLLVLQQYIQRFSACRISFQTVRDTHFHAKVIIVMNNSSQFHKFLALQRTKFALFMDESDLTQDNPLVPLATNQFHITATPFQYQPIFNRIIRVDIPHNYYGIERVQILPKTYIDTQTDFLPIIRDFTTNSGGILLINQFSAISEMNDAALLLSNKCDLRIVVLSTVKKIYFKGRSTTIRLDNIQSIIDFLPFKHIIIIANRMANRGLSFTSSDFKRHITHQVFGDFNNITSFLQKSRIFGVYNDSPTLKLFLPPNKINTALSYIHTVQNFSLIKRDILYYYEN